jgi:protein HIRA/HIR1
VKGVAWDPIGTYLASQSDDRSVILWRCEDWTVAARVTEPFVRSVGSTFSLRPCWSPDGRSLTAVNSHQGTIQTAAVLDRGEWKARTHAAGWMHTCAARAEEHRILCISVSLGRARAQACAWFSG